MRKFTIDSGVLKTGADGLEYQSATVINGGYSMWIGAYAEFRTDDGREIFARVEYPAVYDSALHAYISKQKVLLCTNKKSPA